MLAFLVLVFTFLPTEGWLNEDLTVKEGEPSLN